MTCRTSCLCIIGFSVHFTSPPVQDLVPLMGISRTGDGFELGELMNFVGKAYNSPNADVRSEAVRVTKEVYDLVGPAIR